MSSEPRPLVSEVLTAKEARELRRKARKAQRTEKERGVRVLKRAVRQLERGRPQQAVEIVLSGFGGFMLAKLLEKIERR